MRTIGIIAEYNPFHFGHLYHLLKAKKVTGAKASVIVMGGHFLQRGEPAIFHKWLRAQMAIKAGVDLVIELPFVFASQDAKGFSQAGIKLLDAIHIADYVCFGCEHNQPDIFNALADFLNNPPPLFREIQKKELKYGNSYPKIRANAILEYHKTIGIASLKTFNLQALKNILNQPNNILALEYVKCLRSINSLIKPVFIKRKGSSYSQENMSGKYSSATSIRKNILSLYRKSSHHSLQNISQYLPHFSFQLMIKHLEKGYNPIQLSHYEQSIMANLRKISLENLQKIQGIQEGLHNRVKSAALFSNNINDLIQNIKTKRYTHTRIQRILIHSFLGLTRQEVDHFNQNGPLYIRILGFSEKGKYLLNKIKSFSSLPVITRVKDFYKDHNTSREKIGIEMLNYDILATNLYVLGYQNRLSRSAGWDFTKKIIIDNK